MYWRRFTKHHMHNVQSWRYHVAPETKFQSWCWCKVVHLSHQTCYLGIYPQVPNQFGQCLDTVSKSTRKVRKCTDRHSILGHFYSFWGPIELESHCEISVGWMKCQSSFPRPNTAHKPWENVVYRSVVFLQNKWCHRKLGHACGWRRSEVVVNYPDVADASPLIPLFGLVHPNWIQHVTRSSPALLFAEEGPEFFD